MAIAVISEFNPFHNGHKYLLNTAKSIAGEPVIAVMSGSFTQRGEVALTGKFERTKTASTEGISAIFKTLSSFSKTSWAISSNFGELLRS